MRKATMTVDIDKLQEQITTFLFEAGLNYRISREGQLIMLQAVASNDNGWVFVSYSGFREEKYLQVRQYKNAEMSEYRDFKCGVSASRVLKAIGQIHTEKTIARVLGK